MYRLLALMVLTICLDNCGARQAAAQEAHNLKSLKTLLQTRVSPSIGLSGAHYNPATRRIGLIDNNAVNMKEVSVDEPGKIHRVVTLQDFRDPEASAFIKFDPERNRSLIAFFEEGLNRVSQCWVDETIQDQTIGRLNPQDCPDSRVLTRADGTDVWKPDRRFGLEGADYDAKKDVFYIAKQYQPLRFMVCQASGEPDCVEPFDAASRLKGEIIDINDLSVEPETGNVAMISNSSNRVIVINPQTGQVLQRAEIDRWRLGFLCEEGFAFLPDHKAVLTSEPSDLAILSE